MIDDLNGLSGQMLGQYELRELLGKGGMGVVYRAFQAALRREVALKILPASLAEQSNYIERFNREAQTAASLEHPHIVPIYDYGTQHNTSYVVMRLLLGGSLAQRLKQRSESLDPLPSLGETNELLQQLASALDYGHSRGVIHRDIKPSNVMFDNQGLSYLVDFGIAKLMDSTSAITGTGMSMGTPSYMPPEQWRGDSLTPTADQYALAVMMYSMVTGKLPFEAPTPYALMHKHLHEMPTPLHAWRRDVPEEVNRVLERAMAKEGHLRFKTVTEFSQAFNGAIAGVEGGSTVFFTFKVSSEDPPTVRPSQAPVIASAPGTAPGLPAPTAPITAAVPTYRNPLAWGMGVIILLLIVVLAFLVLSNIGPDDSELRQTQVVLNVQTAVAANAASDREATQTQIALIAAAITDEPTEAPTETPTDEPTATDTEDPTATDAASPTDEPTSSDEPTDEPTTALTEESDATTVTVLIVDTESPTDTRTPRPTRTLSRTPRPTSTEVATDAASPTDEPTATNTATDQPTIVALAPDTDTPEPSPTDTDTPSPTATDTSTDTPSPTVTDMPTDTPTDTPSPTNTVTATDTPSDTPTDTPEPSETQTPAVSDTPDRPATSMALILGAQATLTEIAANVTATPSATPTQVLSDRDATTSALVRNAQATLTEIANSANANASSTPAAADSQITFSSNRDGDYEIYVMDADGGNARQLTFNTADDLEPDWSPDRRHIVFSSNVNGGYSLFVLDVASGGAQRITTGSSGAEGQPDWSPDGSEIVFTSLQGDTNEIFVVSADGSNLRRLTNNAVNDWYPNWSPDGERLVFVTDAVNGDVFIGDIYIMNTAGTVLQTITRNEQDDLQPEWSPDGSEIVFASDRDGDFEVYVYSLTTTGTNPNLRQLTNNTTSYDVQPAWSPDGSHIVYISGESVFEIFTMDAQGGNQQRLTENSNDDIHPDW